MITNDSSDRGKDTLKERFELRATIDNLLCGEFDHYPTRDEMVAAMWEHKCAEVEVHKVSRLMRWSVAADGHVPVFDVTAKGIMHMARDLSARMFAESEATTEADGTSGKFSDTHTRRALQEMNDTLTEEAAVPAGTPFFGMKEYGELSAVAKLERKIHEYGRIFGNPPSVIVIGHEAYGLLYAECTHRAAPKITGRLSRYKGIPVQKGAEDDDTIPGNAIYVGG
jgi:hypothetical protein